MSRMTSKHFTKKIYVRYFFLQYIQQTVNSIIKYAIKFNKLETLKNYVLIVYCKRQTIPNKKKSQIVNHIPQDYCNLL